jgi:hypothetical protein
LFQFFSSAFTPADSEEGIEKLEEIFLSNPRMQLTESLFPDEARPAPSRIITFDKETRRPTQMPYVMLDPKWYQGTTDEERLQQGAPSLSLSARPILGRLWWCTSGVLEPPQRC